MRKMKNIKRITMAALVAFSVVIACGCTKSDDPNNGGGGNNGGGNGGGTYNGHEYVDLGLPSGTLWATCNVGATSPEEYGGYFAWGETHTKSTYEWSNYRYCNGDWDELTKYCSHATSGYNGFTDSLTTLLPEDDAATAKWGSGWCMPTEAQWRELFQNIAYTRTYQNGAYGILFTASNGNSLFLPAAGCYWYGEYSSCGHRCFYWSSSRNRFFSEAAWFFDCYSLEIGLNSCNRARGLSVRAVRSARQN